MFKKLRTAMAYNFKQYECIDGKHIYRHSIIKQKFGQCNFIQYCETVFNHVPTKRDIEKVEQYTLKEAKEYMCRKIDEAFKNSKHIRFKEYDFWFDSEQRNAMKNCLLIEKNKKLLVTNISIDLTIFNCYIDDAFKFIELIESYSKKCYLEAVKHKQKIQELSSIELVLGYENNILMFFPKYCNIDNKFRINYVKNQENK